MKIKTKKNNSIISDLRNIREKISTEMKGMSPQEVLEFLKNKETLSKNTNWQ